MRLVVDASVAAKWFIVEPFEAEATELLDPGWELIAPELLWAETAHVLRQRLRRQELTARDFSRSLTLLHSVIDMESASNRLLLGPAGRLAVTLDHGIYDCFYLALADREGCRLVTADRRLHDKLERSPIAGLTLWIEDLP